MAGSAAMSHGDDTLARILSGIEGLGTRMTQVEGHLGDMKAIREEVFAHHQKFEVLAEQLASVQATTDVMSDALANLGESD
eukprot:4560854-Pyramimonas_sp.AAC.1